MVASTRTVSSILQEMADLIEQVGLYRGAVWPGVQDKKSYQSGCPVCVYGALRVVLGDTTPRVIGPLDPKLVSVESYMHSYLGRWPHGWSDANSHRPEYVVCELRRMADRALVSSTG